MTDAPLLNLNTLIVRPAIVIDDIRFEILNADELSVLDSHRLSVWGRRIEALTADQNAADGVELAELIDNVVKTVVVDLPAEVFERLPGGHKQQITDVFTALLLRTKLDTAGAIARAAGLPIGETSFLGSSASTGAIRSGGLWSRLRRWFGLT